jgi:glycosyltransferase involved in cell wall biosynthesis
MGSPTITIIVTVLNDKRVGRTIESIRKQTVAPLEVIVADGGSKDGTFELVEELAKNDKSLLPRKLPGTIPESRNQAIAIAQGELVAFLDADEVAPEGWLEALVAPFGDPKIGFTAGPTPALPGTAGTIGAAYYDAYLNRFYEKVASKNLHALPMGNSAWRTSLFKELGALDTTLYPKAASEDQDFALRVLKAGHKGCYVPAAWVHHDYSGLTVAKLLSKQATYATGGYVVWRRKKSTYEASGSRMTPYLIPPAMLVIALIMLVAVPSLALVAEVIAALGVLAFTALFMALLVDGIIGDSRYPGWRFRPVEILRQWVTLYGAFRGLLKYGLSGRAESEPTTTESG